MISGCVTQEQKDIQFDLDSQVFLNGNDLYLRFGDLECTARWELKNNETGLLRKNNVEVKDKIKFNKGVLTDLQCNEELECNEDKCETDKYYINLDPEVGEKGKPKEVIIWRDNCETRCVDNKCNKVIGQTIWVAEGNTCVAREEAKSLKGTKLYLEIIEDEKYPVTCSDWNWTHRYCDFSSLELNKDIPLSTGNFDDESFVVNNSINLKFTSLSDKQSLWIEAENKVIKYGDNSTEIILQDANTENLDDAELRSSDTDSNDGAVSYITIIKKSDGREWTPIIKFNISEIPQEVTIQDVSLNLRVQFNGLDSGESYYSSVHHVFAFPTFAVDGIEWWEGNDICNLDGEICWDERPVSGEYNETIEDNFTFGLNSPVSGIWAKWNVTKMVTADYEAGNPNVSMWIRSNLTSGSPASTDWIQLNSKEQITIAYRPYLNITYLAPAPPDTCDSCNIDCSDNCVITTPKTCSILSFYNTGTFTIEADIHVDKIGTKPQGCQVVNHPNDGNELIIIGG